MARVLIEQGRPVGPYGLSTHSVPPGSPVSWPTCGNVAAAGAGRPNAARASAVASPGQRRRAGGQENAAVMETQRPARPTNAIPARGMLDEVARPAQGPATLGCRPRRRGGVATQRPAKPRTPVRFRSAPLSRGFYANRSSGLRRDAVVRLAPAEAERLHEVGLVGQLGDGAEHLLAVVADHPVDDTSCPSVISADAGVEAFVLTHRQVLSLRALGTSMRP